MSNQLFHLISHSLCPYVQRSVIVLEEKNIPYKRTDIDLANKPDWFLRLSPMGKVPVLQTGKDRTLFESAVITEYLNEITPSSLHPQDLLEKAYHRAWIEFGSGILNSIAGLYNAKDEKSFEHKRVEIQTKFQQLEGQINGEIYFSGENFQLIDAVYGPIFRYFDVFEQFTDLQIFSGLTRVRNWRNNLSLRPSVKKAVNPDYPELLLNFLKQRNSYISELMAHLDRRTTSEHFSG